MLFTITACVLIANSAGNTTHIIGTDELRLKTGTPTKVWRCNASATGESKRYRVDHSRPLRRLKQVGS